MKSEKKKERKCNKEHVLRWMDENKKKKKVYWNDTEKENE